MSWREFSYLLEGLSGETPLGRIVAIRAESDPKKLKEFTPEQRKIRGDYLSKQAEHKSSKQMDDILESIKNVFMGMSR